mmetsp:Transcript_17885/g.25342  ORF Transcript_17885/g.25342 Transcript_17885/m.25342 type:complete len:101 (-) Transcript_17885:137-439(-)
MGRSGAFGSRRSCLSSSVLLPVENHPCWSATDFVRPHCCCDILHRCLPLPAAAEDRAAGSVLENKGREEESEATKPIIVVDVANKWAEKNLIRWKYQRLL